MFIPRIHTDLDFLVARLFYADSGHGQVFKDIQIHKDLDERTSQDHELLYLLNSVHSHLLNNQIDALEASLSIEDVKEKWKRKMDFRQYFRESNFGEVNVEEQVYSYFEQRTGVDKKIWSHSPLRSVLFSFLKFAPANDLAMDISFGNRIGHSLILARVFYNSVTVHFNKFYRNQKEICREDNYQANFRTFTYPANIFSQTAQSITKSEKLIINLFNEIEGGRQLNLILIGPITDQSKRVTTNLLIEKIHEHEGYLSDRAILLAIRPLMIGPKSCTGRFIQYQPPKGIFSDIEEEVSDDLVKSNVPVYSVGPNGDVTKIEPKDLKKYQESCRSSTHNPKEQKPPPYGLVIQCNDVQCIYEFRVFRKKDPEKEQSERREQR
ncbi:PREDICTED: uncharacterized protein LOC109581174 [Amphimedon queenslandica]|uniref:Uncharacterized protein n=1 Tax=Amphimedon queenslandica TaxID=400682 RepID=A0AAN0J0S1_AMPQE|nr:PREDICTED: uncharacterized protein LOC109581174 [Amphimedon queenslandica]|eukprot:XP_019850595.1 PREDICTED: uncharacterized protein LOC109581174 [Amphimedon queenslandica]